MMKGLISIVAPVWFALVCVSSQRLADANPRCPADEPGRDDVFSSDSPWARVASSAPGLFKQSSIEAKHAGRDAYPEAIFILSGRHRDDVSDSFEGSEKSGLLLNVSAPNVLKALFQTMWERSPTFRRQCRRISEAENLRIEIVFVPKLPLNNMFALSTVKREEGGIIAVLMKLRAPGNYVEAIAHEFEHALEQLEGLDLKALAARKESNVSRNEVYAYETARALETGRRVRDEYRRAGDCKARAQSRLSAESLRGCD